MSRRKTQRRPLRKYSIGDMRERIGLCSRVIRPGGFSSAGFSETYTVDATIWANVVTDNGVHRFNQVNIEPGQTPTHFFTIRRNSAVTAETVIQYGGEYYEILRVINPEERSEYLVLPAKLKGSTTKTAAT